MDVCADKCVDVCADKCRRVHRHAHGHVYGHAHRHWDERVYRPARTRLLTCVRKGEQSCVQMSVQVFVSTWRADMPWRCQEALNTALHRAIRTLTAHYARVHARTHTHACYTRMCKRMQLRRQRPHGFKPHVVMAYIVMAYVVMTYMFMAYIAMASQF